MSLSYTTTNGEKSGRASHYFKSMFSAVNRAETQNALATEMGIQSRYTIAQCDADGIPATEIRS